MTRAIAAAFAAVLTTAPALSASPAGDPITDKTHAAVAELTRIVDALDAAVDAKDWALARGLFADEIAVDFASLTGQPPATIPADALVGGWSANLTPEKASFHLRGNHRVTFDGSDAATVRSHGYAWNRLEAGALPQNGGEPLWEVWGTYEHRLARTPDGWTITGMTFTATAQRGNPFVRDTPGA